MTACDDQLLRRPLVPEVAPRRASGERSDTRRTATRIALARLAQAGGSDAPVRAGPIRLSAWRSRRSAAPSVAPMVVRRGAPRRFGALPAECVEQHFVLFGARHLATGLEIAPRADDLALELRHIGDQVLFAWLDLSERSWPHPVHLVSRS